MENILLCFTKLYFNLKSMQISIVIPNYNGVLLLKKNLKKVLDELNNYTKIAKSNAELIITDDYSSDNSVEFLHGFSQENKKSSIEIKILTNSRNLGFSSNVDRAVEYANGEIIILLNTDVVPEKHFLFPLLTHFDNEKVFAVGCMDKSIENGETVLRGRGVGKWEKGFLLHSRGDIQKNDSLWVSGGSGAFRRTTWELLKGLDTLYDPFYWEDIDLSYRALKAGFQVIFEKESTVIHEHEKGSIKKKYTPYQVKKIAYRNQFIFVWKNITDTNLLISHFIWLPYHMITAFMRKDWAFFYGFAAAFIKLPVITQHRKKMKSLFLRTDIDILNSFHFPLNHERT